MTARAGDTLCVEGSSAPTISCATVNGADTENSGATTAGSIVLAMQQSFWTDLLDAGAAAQQSCAPLCICCRQTSDGVTNVPINKMATAARWKTPCNMVLAYYGTHDEGQRITRLLNSGLHPLFSRRPCYFLDNDFRVLLAAGNDDALQSLRGYRLTHALQLGAHHLEFVHWR